MNHSFSQLSNKGREGAYNQKEFSMVNMMNGRYRITTKKLIYQISDEHDTFAHCMAAFLLGTGRRPGAES